MGRSDPALVFLSGVTRGLYIGAAHLQSELTWFPPSHPVLPARYSPFWRATPSKFLFPMPGGFFPKCSVFLIERVPSKLLAFFSLFSEELIFIN
jgi:hypothetical protein